LQKKYTNIVAIVNDNLEDPRVNDEDCSRCVDCKYGYSNGDTNGNEIIFCVKMKEFLYEETDMIKEYECGDDYCSDFDEGYPRY